MDAKMWMVHLCFVLINQSACMPQITFLEMFLQTLKMCRFIDHTVKNYLQQHKGHCSCFLRSLYDKVVAEHLRSLQWSATKQLL